MSLEFSQEDENTGLDNNVDDMGGGVGLEGYPATIRMSTSKRYQKRRSGYDKSQLDMAVDLVIKNKLSMRAASHIYKIPFSTLRTRKVFLTSGMTAAEYDRLNKSKAKKHINDLLPPSAATSTAHVTRGSNGEEEEEEEDENEEDMMMGDEVDADSSGGGGMMNNGFDETEIGLEEEDTDDVKPSQQPITIASLAAASNQNLLASFTSLINSRPLMPNNNNNNNLVSALNGSNSTLVKKPNILLINNGSNVPQKRLYIKHGQLDTILSSRGLPIGGKQPPVLTNIRAASGSFTNNNNNNNNTNRTVTQVVNSKNGNHHASGSSHNGTIRGIYNSLNANNSNTNNSSNHQFAYAASNGSGTASRLSIGMSASRPATASLKLASILSGTMLSMRNKPTGSRPPIQHTIKTTAHAAASSYSNSNNKIDRRPSGTITTTTKTSSNVRTTNSIEKINEPIANSEYLSRVGVLEEDYSGGVGGKKAVAYKCPKCELLFVNSFFLNQHLNNNNSKATVCRTKSSSSCSSKKDDRVVFADSLDSCKHFTCSFCSLTTLDKCSFLAHVSMCPAAS